MKGKAALAAVVITLCFLIGYLTYFATNLFVGFLQDQMGNCDKQTSACEQQRSERLDY